METYLVSLLSVCLTCTGIVFASDIAVVITIKSYRKEMFKLEEIHNYGDVSAKQMIICGNRDIC